MASQEQSSDDELEELLKIASSAPIQAPQSDTHLFIKSYPIQRGSKTIKMYQLYEVYKRWSKNPDEQPVFREIIKHYFHTESKYGKLIVYVKKNYHYIEKREMDKAKRQAQVSNPQTQGE